MLKTCKGNYLLAHILKLLLYKKQISKFIDLSQETVTADVGAVNSRVIQDFVPVSPPKCQSNYIK